MTNPIPLYLTLFAISFLITLLFTNLLIPVLKKAAKQPIYAVGPKWHLTKSGTPTMGGLAFLIAITLSLSFAAVILIRLNEQDHAREILLCLAFAVLNSAVGILDDRAKIRKKENLGLKPYQKLILQALIGIGFLIARALWLGTETTVVFGNLNFDLGFAYYPLSLIIILGITNCANLTDGVDGLLSTVSFAIGVGAFYLGLIFSLPAAIMASALIGAMIAFLIFNVNPAKIFMGDTGSLFLGALVCGIAFALGNPLLSLVLGVVFVFEGASVILQVIGFKLTGKRIFKMAPLHHHLEKYGFGESKICVYAIIITLISCIITVAVLFP